MNQSVPKISGSLRGAALGATLAMLPISIILFFVAIEVIRDPSESFGNVVVVFQFIGCLIWAGFLTSCISPAKQLNISSGGLGLCALGALVGGIIQLICSFAPDLFEKFMMLANGEAEGLILTLLISCFANLPIAFGLISLGRKLPALKKAKIAYIILAAYPLLIFLIGKLLLSDGYSSHNQVRLYLILSLTLLLLCCALTTIGWWGAASNAEAIEKDAEENPEYLATNATYVEQPTSTATTASYAQSPQPAPAPQCASAITDEQKELLQSMSDDELSKIINNPTLYANQAFVNEARNIQIKRQAWEAIKDYTDEQLLSVVHDNIQGFTSEVLDAASMELLSRQNQTFVNEVASLTSEELHGIANNPGNYYDGYIQLARQILAQRLNPSQGNNITAQ